MDGSKMDKLKSITERLIKMQSERDHYKFNSYTGAFKTPMNRCSADLCKRLDEEMEALEAEYFKIAGSRRSDND